MCTGVQCEEGPCYGVCGLLAQWNMHMCMHFIAKSAPVLCHDWLWGLLAP